jgi:hypothetical protein
MFRQSQQLATEYDDQVRGIAELHFSPLVLYGNGGGGRYLSFLLLTRHDEEFCSGMNDIDFF